MELQVGGGQSGARSKGRVVFKPSGNTSTRQQSQQWSGVDLIWSVTMLSRSSSRAAAAAAGNSEPRDQLHIEKEDTKYTGYLDGILRDYSVKQTR
jgi:hypothetical protein